MPRYGAPIHHVSIDVAIAVWPGRPTPARKLQSLTLVTINHQNTLVGVTIVPEGRM